MMKLKDPQFLGSAFAGLNLWYVCSLTFLILLPQLTAIPIANISHIGVLILLPSKQSPAKAAQIYELCICCI